MIDGMRMDLIKPRYETFDELYEYCYRVAGTVALMSVPIMGISPNYKGSTVRPLRRSFSAGSPRLAPQRAPPARRNLTPGAPPPLCAPSLPNRRRSTAPPSLSASRTSSRTSSATSGRTSAPAAASTSRSRTSAASASRSRRCGPGPPGLASPSPAEPG